jgi:alkanesulfonate monooxygenase
MTSAALEATVVQIFTVAQPLLPGENEPSGLLWRTSELEASEAVDRVLIGYSPAWPHNHACAPYMLAATAKLSLIVAHRPGVMEPAAAARYFATLDVISQGRLAVSLDVGDTGSILPQEDGYLDHVPRYQRAAQYLDVMRRTWAIQAPSRRDTAPGGEGPGRQQPGQPPIYMSGDSPGAVDLAARYADMYMLWGAPLAAMRQRIGAVSAAARRYGRSLRFAVGLRLFLGDTEEDAWAQAREAEWLLTLYRDSPLITHFATGGAPGSRPRQLPLASQELHDDCLWTRLVTVLGGRSSSVAMVGTPDRVLTSLRSYRDLGVSAFLCTTGPFGVWEPQLENFLLRVKREL